MKNLVKKLTNWLKNQKDQKKIEDRFNEILSALPKSWSDLKMKDFLIIINIENDVDEDLGDGFAQAKNDFNIISALSDATVEELSDMPIKDIAVLTNALSFIYKLPTLDNKSKIKWKTVEEITYDNLGIYHKYYDGTMKNIQKIIKAFSKDKLSEEQILEMNMQDAHTGFFFLRLVVQKFINSSLTITKKQLKKLKKTLPTTTTI